MASSLIIAHFFKAINIFKVGINSASIFSFFIKKKKEGGTKAH